MLSRWRYAHRCHHARTKLLLLFKRYSCEKRFQWFRDTRHLNQRYAKAVICLTLLKHSIHFVRRCEHRCQHAAARNILVEMSSILHCFCRKWFLIYFGVERCVCMYIHIYIYVHIYIYLYIHVLIPFGVRAAAAGAILSPKNKKGLLANILKRYETNDRKVSTKVKHVELHHQHVKLVWAFIIQIFNRCVYFIVKQINVLTIKYPPWSNILMVKYPHRLNILNFVIKMLQLYGYLSSKCLSIVDT